MDAESKKSLFRIEHLKHLTQRLHGDIGIALPVSWQVIGYFLFAVLLVALAFVCTASYARVETVTGVVTLDKGVISIVPSRSGIVTELPVREGSVVRPGDTLLKVRAEEELQAGETAPERILVALDQQDRSFETQAEYLARASAVEQARLTGQVEGLTREIEGLDAQIALQERVTELAARLLRHARQLSADGFISKHDLDVSESDLLSKRQQLTQLRQSRESKRTELANARRAIAQAAANAQAQVAGLSSSRAQVALQAAQAHSAQGYALTSPVNGTVTAVTARVGQVASTSTPTMLVVPNGSNPVAELFAPSSAVGFLEVGQDVRLNIDAFPYEQFGVVQGRIEEIASAAVMRTMADGRSAPIYLIEVSLPQPWIMGFGRRHPLLAGMTLSARIVTRKRTLLEWLFEPIYSMSRR
ncbi:MAG TPA: HlyD family efflux transporter periplasmic adaptor subunit [Steroidobacteraceae bacterium]|nr:HlyD family efflux transporter periplasmic adaptor subunit [Steroidobacteraceae bacterium]